MTVLKRVFIIIAAVLALAFLTAAAPAAEAPEPVIDVNEVFIAQNNRPPQRLEHSGKSLRTELSPGATVYFSIKNARRAEDLNGYRAVLDWNKGEEYTTHIRIEYREMFDYDGATSLGYRYVIAMGIAETNDDIQRTLRGNIKLALRRNHRTEEISFTLSVSSGAAAGDVTEIFCDSPDVGVVFETLGESVVMHFNDFCSFEVATAGQEELNAGCTDVPLTDIAERYRDAELSFISWGRRPIFDHIGKLSVYSREGMWLYELRGGRLYDVSESYDGAQQAFILSTRRLEGYVLSDRELPPDAPLIPEPNPPTAA